MKAFLVLNLIIIIFATCLLFECAAALSELYRRMQPLGATHMTGGASPFYEKIGYELAVVWTHWMKFE